MDKPAPWPLIVQRVGIGHYTVQLIIIIILFVIVLVAYNTTNIMMIDSIWCSIFTLLLGMTQDHPVLFCFSLCPLRLLSNLATCYCSASPCYRPPEEGQVIRLSPLYVPCSAEASSEVLTLQCYALSVIVLGQRHIPGYVCSHGQSWLLCWSCWWCCGSGTSKVRLAEPFLAYLLLIAHTAPTSYHDLTTRLLL